MTFILVQIAFHVSIYSLGAWHLLN